MNPQLRRLATAAACLLVVAGLLSFAVGRITRASEREAQTAQSMAELAAFRDSDREAYLRAKARGHAAGVIAGRRNGHRAGRARGDAKRSRIEAASAVTASAQAQPACGRGSLPDGDCKAPSQERQEPSGARPAGRRENSQPDDHAGAGASSRATPRRRRSVRVRKRWTTSAAGTRHAVRRTSRTTTTSGGRKRTRVRTSRKVYWTP